jgi:hypothetical protein
MFLRTASTEGIAAAVGENFHEEGYDRGAFRMVAELRDPPVNGEPRESTSRGSFISGHSYPAFKSSGWRLRGAESGALAL